ncbi:MAG: nucleotide exchange factor GrpE [Anaerolineae bacterium]
MADEEKSQLEKTAEPEKQTSEPRAEAVETTVLAEEQTRDIESLQQEMEKQKKLAEYHLTQWKRTAADLENYRKRMDRERVEWLKFGQADLITKMLTILDDFERAFQTMPAALNGLTWIEGLALIERKLHLIMEQQGLKEIEAVGKPFDPSVHQAVKQEENATHPDGQVIAIIQRGYMLHDRVLRPAMVVVAKNIQNRKGAKENQTAGQAENQEQRNAIK